MSREKIGSAGQVEVIMNQGRQSLYPHVITCAESEQAYSDDGKLHRNQTQLQDKSVSILRDW